MEDTGPHIFFLPSRARPSKTKAKAPAFQQPAFFLSYRHSNNSARYRFGLHYVGWGEFTMGLGAQREMYSEDRQTP